MPAASVAYPRFSYRRNKDNTVDAICLNCLLTAATADSEAKLHELEVTHRCPEDCKVFSSGSERARFEDRMNNLDQTARAVDR
jgi:hypothetical protein